MRPSVDSVFKLKLSNETNGEQEKVVSHVEKPMGGCERCINCGSLHDVERTRGDSA